MDFKALINNSIEQTFKQNGRSPNEGVSKPALQETRKPSAITKGASIIKEALNTLPKAFILKTEKLSAKTKQSHEILYKAYVDAFNKSSSQLDASSKEEANSNYSAYRSVSGDMVANMNAVKLHELYFANISDLASEITMDSIPFIKISRDFGSFERWQYDFIACCMSSKNGWALCVYDTYKKAYMNVVVDGDTVGLPLGAIPIIAIDMFEHAYSRDYGSDKKSYIVSMMRELNWNVIEARMVIAERSQLHDLWMIMPMVNSQPVAMLSAAEAAAPVPVQPVAPSNSTNQQTVPATANPPKQF